MPLFILTSFVASRFTGVLGDNLGSSISTGAPPGIKSGHVFPSLVRKNSPMN